MHGGEACACGARSRVPLASAFVISSVGRQCYFVLTAFSYNFISLRCVNWFLHSLRMYLVQSVGVEHNIKTVQVFVKRL